MGGVVSVNSRRAESPSVGRREPLVKSGTGEVRRIPYANAVRVVTSCAIASGNADSVAGVVVGAAMRRF